MTLAEHRREQRRTPHVEEHRRTNDAPTADGITAGHSTDGSTDGTDAPEHRRIPPVYIQGKPGSTPPGGPILDPTAAGVVLVRLDGEMPLVLAEALGGYRRALLAAGRQLPAGLEPLLHRMTLCARARQALVVRVPGADHAPVALLDLDQAAALCRLSRRTLQRRIAAGQLRVRRSGRRVLFHPDDIAAHLDPGPPAA